MKLRKEESHPEIPDRLKHYYLPDNECDLLIILDGRSHSYRQQTVMWSFQKGAADCRT
jgi:hypothetical protein